MTRNYSKAIAALFTALATACAGGNGTPNMPQTGVPRLIVVGPDTRQSGFNTELQVQVKYLDGQNQPRRSSIVSFAIVGDAGGSTLSGNTASTNNDGIATVIVRAGATAVDFRVQATASDVNTPAVIRVSVRQSGFVSMIVQGDYVGSRSVQTVEMGLFTNTTCTALQTRIPTVSQKATERLRVDHTFSNLETRLPIAVYGLGIDSRDQVAAEVCTDVVLTGDGTRVVLALRDGGDSFAGTWTVEERLDTTAGLPGAINIALEAMAAFAPRNCRDGTLESCTSPPAPGQYLIDLIKEIDAIPSAVRTTLGFVGPVAAAFINSYYDNYWTLLPDFVNQIFLVSRGLDTALNSMVLLGEMTFQAPNELNQFTGRHRVTAMRVNIPTGTRERTIRGADVAIQGMYGDRVQIASHAMPIAYGTLVQTTINDILLPDIVPGASSFGDLVTRVLDCSDLGDFTSGAIGASAAEAACRAGATVASTLLENQIMTLLNYDTLNLAETGRFIDSNQDYIRDRIDMGTVQASWTSTTLGELNFPGVLAGARAGATAAHPIRQAFRGPN